MSKPRAKTADECRDEFLGFLSVMVEHCLNEKRAPTARDKLNLLVFSILNVFDGTSGGCMAFDLVSSAHPDDEQFHKDEGKNWTPIGVNIANGALHDLWVRRYEPKE